VFERVRVGEGGRKKRESNVTTVRHSKAFAIYSIAELTVEPSHRERGEGGRKGVRKWEGEI
jgi:hypothetical protein